MSSSDETCPCLNCEKKSTFKIITSLIETVKELQKEIDYIYATVNEIRKSNEKKINSNDITPKCPSCGYCCVYTQIKHDL